MRKEFLGALAAFLFVAGHVRAQSGAGVAPSMEPPRFEPRLADARIDAASWTDGQPQPYQVWARAEYLLWRVKDAPLPIPLVTTGDPQVGFPTINSAGAIGESGTRVLYGNSNIDFGAFSGGRFELGGWLSTDRIVGIEGSGFFLERQSSLFSARSDALGNPPLYFPAFNALAGAERALAIADPLRLFSGDVAVQSTLQLWGAEANGALTFWRSIGAESAAEAALLVGFRYADLRESLTIRNSTDDLLFINTTVLNDRFGTRNQFAGGQLGSRVSLQADRFFVDVIGKVALGGTHGVVNVQGDISQSGPGAFAPGTFAGGLFTQPTNIGRRTETRFSIIPAVEVHAGIQLTDRIRATIGYDFLYWTQVVRPGNQIDRNINPSQSPLFGAGALTGPAVPNPLVSHSDFWAHGVSAGLELRY